MYPLDEELLPLAAQVGWQLVSHTSRGRREELAQRHNELTVLRRKQLHPGVPESSRVLTGSLVKRGQETEQSKLDRAATKDKNNSH